MNEDNDDDDDDGADADDDDDDDEKWWCRKKRKKDKAPHRPQASNLATAAWMHPVCSSLTRDEFTVELGPLGRRRRPKWTLMDDDDFYDETTKWRRNNQLVKD